MAKEAFSVGFEAANYHRKPIEGEPIVVFKAREQEIRNNLLRYLGEYRLAVKFDEFFYQEGSDLLGRRYLMAEENFPVIDKFRNAIAQKEREGQDSRREVAECFGFEKIEDKFLAGDDFLFLWVSPPGRREDGYGNYSFTFAGEVRDGKIRVVPYRNELSLDEHRDIAGLFSDQDFQKDTDFLANPIFIQRSDSYQRIEDLLSTIGEKERIDLSWRIALEKKISGLTDTFIDAIKRNAPKEELERIKRAIENFTIDKKEEISSGQITSYKVDTKILIDSYGSYAPPVVSGSCGSSSSTLMEFQNTSSLEPDEHGERTFSCPECGKTNVRPKGELLKNCQHCGTSKVAC